jgi:hypothetical protein
LGENGCFACALDVVFVTIVRIEDCEGRIVRATKRSRAPAAEVVRFCTDDSVSPWAYDVEEDPSGFPWCMSRDAGGHGDETDIFKMFLEDQFDEISDGRLCEVNIGLLESDGINVMAFESHVEFMKGSNVVMG